jgi:hypothetical protein
VRGAWGSRGWRGVRYLSALVSKRGICRGGGVDIAWVRLRRRVDVAMGFDLS